MSVFAGLDGGGTKTLCVLANEKGEFLGAGQGGPSNYLFCGKALAAQSTQDSIAAAFEAAGIPERPLKGAFVCSAAIEIYCGEKHLPFFASCINAETIRCESDILPVWFGATQFAPAILSIAGTGAATYACKGKEYAKTSGFGALLGDEGSGYDIGRRALNFATRVFDGREQDDAFLQAVMDHFGIAPNLRQIYRLLREGDERSLVASATVPVVQLFKQGNQTARRLLNHAADEIALAVRVAGRAAAFGAPVSVVASGSMLKPELPLFALLQEKLKGDAGLISACIFAPVHPAVAAAALALYEAGLKDAASALLESGKGIKL